jgi:hypothetical protein
VGFAPLAGFYSEQKLMEEAVTRKIRILTVVCALGVFDVSYATAQKCLSLGIVDKHGLVSYLEQTKPNDDNAECITLAVKNLGQERYEPAISALINKLDFRRPPNAHEKVGVRLHPQVIEELYPAANALEEIALPSERTKFAVQSAILDAIGSASSSDTARENAVAVWMFLHREKPSKGVALLRQEAVKASDPGVKENYISALSRAQTHCGPSDKSRCKAAARLPKP